MRDAVLAITRQNEAQNRPYIASTYNSSKILVHCTEENEPSSVIKADLKNATIKSIFEDPN